MLIYNKQRLFSICITSKNVYSESSFHNMKLGVIMELKKLLGKRIQELRTKNGLKQSELAEKVGIATKHQSCIETGKNYPSAELVENYAKVFSVDVTEMLDITHIKTTDELLSDIYSMLKSASEEEILMVHKILKGVLH